MTSGQGSAASKAHSTESALSSGKSQSAESAIPERLRSIVDSHSDIVYAERVREVNALGTHLTAEEIASLYKYLRAPAANVSDLEGENWLRNEMLNKLAQQATVPPGLAEELAAIYHDTTQDNVARDYAVQHMPSVYRRVDAAAQAVLQAALWQATGETDTSIGGTALLALVDLAGSGAGVERGRLADVALNLAGSDRCGELTRITAVEVCGRLQVGQALTVVQGLAQNSTSQPLQIAATAALGDFGTPEAEEALKHLAEGADPRLAEAAQLNLRRIARAQAALSKRGKS